MRSLRSRQPLIVCSARRPFSRASPSQERRMGIRGVKAAGLSELPQAWTPPYVTITADVATALAGEVATRTASQIANRLVASSVAGKLDRLFKAAPDGVIVRSSAPDEGM